MNISLISLYGKVTVNIPNISEPDVHKVIIEFLMIIGDVDTKTFNITVNPLQVMSKEKKAELGQFIGKSLKVVPVLSELRQWIKTVENDETIFITSGEIDKNYENEILFHLMKENTPDFNIDAHNSAKELQSQIEDNYNISFFNEKKAPIGEFDKSKRICIFCGKKVEDGVTFKKKAHAISESLGNKHLIQNEECDQCNEMFGNTFEEDISNFFLPYRVMYGVTGKKGIPKQKYHPTVNFSNEKGDFIVESSLENEFDETTEYPKVIQVPIAQEVCLQGIYKSFVKYFVALKGNNIRNEIETITQWLNGAFEWDNKLPVIASRIEYGLFAKEPWIVCYTRSSDDTKLPKYVLEFHTLMFCYVVIIPFIEDSETNFSDTSSYNYFWERMPHYNKASDWNFMNFDSNIKRNMIFNFNMVQREI